MKALFGILMAAAMPALIITGLRMEMTQAIIVGTVLGGLFLAILMNTISVIWICIEQEELPWQIFGKSATEGEYGKGKNNRMVPTVQWTDRSFRNQRGENLP